MNIRIRFECEIDGKPFSNGVEIIDNNKEFVSNVAQKSAQLAQKCIMQVLIEKKICNKDDALMTSKQLLRAHVGEIL